jgi:Flp pilus assembly protein TadG
MRKGILLDRKGTVLVSFTVLLTALAGFIALGIEMGTWYVTRAELSKAVDAAALAGAANIASPNLNITQLAQDFGDSNFAPGFIGTAGSGNGAVSYAVSTTTSQVSVTGSTNRAGIITPVFGVNSVTVTATGVGQKNHVEIMLIFDCSGSMAGTPIANLQKAATGFLSFFTPDQAESMVGVVTFSTAATVNVPLETNFASTIQNVINSLNANGGTNAADAVAAAGAQLPVQTGTPNATWKQQYIVFFTDGEPTCFTSTFKHANASNSYVVCASPNTSGSNQWYDVYPYLASPTTGTYGSVNPVQTGLGQNESTCVVKQGNTSTYSTSWATPFAAYPPSTYAPTPDPYTTAGYCDIPQGNPGPRTTLATYVHNVAEQMALDNAAPLKARGVKVYTIGLQGDGGIDTTFLSNLSSGSNYAFVAPNSSQLSAIFAVIAKDITLQLVK